MKFANSSRAKKKADKCFASIKSKLASIESDNAIEFVEWLDRKTTFFRQSLDRSGYGPQPDDLSRGDVVWVEFGINVGTELSDYSTKGHYAIVWAVDLGNVIVIPLTSHSTPGSNMTFELGVIEGLVEGIEDLSYLKLDAIRSISKRRIGRMPGKTGGKVIVNEVMINQIKDYIKISLL